MDPFLGQIVMCGGTFAPRGWMECDGRILQIEEHTALYSLLGTTYGGDGRTDFALPTLSSDSGALYIIAVMGTFPSRN